MNNKKKILMIDDEEKALMSMSSILQLDGYDSITKCSDSREALSLIEKNHFDIILLDLTMPHISGKELLRLINQKYPEISIVVITGHNELSTAVECIKAGAKDFLTKPLMPEQLLSCFQKIIEIQELTHAISFLKKEPVKESLIQPDAFREIITCNNSMIKLFQYMEAIASSSHPILITGDTGVGKELFAKAVHSLSHRKGNLVSVNIAGLDENMFSDTLFGHAKGSFTGAEKERQGLICQASGGTIFLDEIGDLQLSSQVKLLRLLQEHEYMSVGSDITKQSDARVVAATNCNLSQLQEAGKFRKDLYHRLAGHHIHIPRLCERKDDIPLLVNQFIKFAAIELKINEPTYTDEFLQNLTLYDFPGNVRELQKIIYEAVSQSQKGKLSSKSILSKINHKENKNIDNHKLNFPEKLPTLKELNKLLIDEALKRANGNQSIAARLLGVSPQALNQKLKRTQV